MTSSVRTNAAAVSLVTTLGNDRVAPGDGAAGGVSRAEPPEALRHCKDAEVLHLDEHADAQESRQDVAETFSQND